MCVSACVSEKMMPVCMCVMCLCVRVCEFGIDGCSLLPICGRSTCCDCVPRQVPMGSAWIFVCGVGVCGFGA